MQLIPLLLSLLIPVISVAQDAGDEDTGDDEDDDDAIVVLGERKSRSDWDVAGESVTVVPIDRRLMAGSEVGDAVARAPGTHVRRLGGLGSFSAVSLRGSAMRQVQVHLDGIPLNPDGGGAFNLSMIPMETLESVAVWRGAAPPALSTSPIGGVVNLRTEQSASPFTISVDGGSWGHLRGLMTGAIVRGDTHILGGAYAQTSQANFEAFDDNNTPTIRIDDRIRNRENNDRTQAGGVLVGERGPWRSVVTGTVREEGVAGPIGGLPDGRLRTLWGMASGSYRPNAFSTVRGWGLARDELRSRAGIPSQQTRLFQGGVHAHTSVLVGQAEVGLSGEVRGDAYTTPTDETSASRLTTTFVPSIRWFYNAWGAVEPVAHTQLWLERSDGINVLKAAFNPRLSFIHAIGPRWRIHAAGGRAVRPPDFIERFGDRGSSIGRPDLQTERSVWADIGIRYVRDELQAEASAFVSDADNRIIFIQTGDRRLVPINSDPSTIAGLEAMFTTMFERTDARLSLTWTESRTRSGPLSGRRLPRVPRFSTQADVGVHPHERVRLGVHADIIAGNAWDQANLLVAPPRFLFGTQVRWDPPSPWPRVEIAIRNIENRLVSPGPADPLYPDRGRILRPMTDFAGYPLPGRTVLVRLTWRPNLLLEKQDP